MATAVRRPARAGCGVPGAAEAPPARGPGRFLLRGNGGVGKTQAAAAYGRSRLAQRDLDLLIWVNASTRDAVVSGFVEAAAELAGARPHLRAEEAATQLPSWLAKTRRRWCVVLDDLSSPGDLHGLWPPTTEHGSTLITTRRRIDALDRRCTVVEFIPFSPQGRWPTSGASSTRRPARTRN